MTYNQILIISGTLVFAPLLISFLVKEYYKSRVVEGYSFMNTGKLLGILFVLVIISIGLGCTLFN